MKSFHFSVIGDLHYVRDNSHRETFADRAGYKGEIADLQRYAWTRDHVLPEIIAAIRNDSQPEALFVLGDIVKGNCDNHTACRSEFKDARSIIEQADCPIYIARAFFADRSFLAVARELAGAYAGHFRLPAPPKFLRMVNNIRITNPGNDTYTIGGLTIKARMADARTIYSSLAPNIYTYTDKWDDWREPLLERMPSGKDITAHLKFWEEEYGH